MVNNEWHPLSFFRLRKSLVLFSFWYEKKFFALKMMIFKKSFWFFPEQITFFGKILYLIATSYSPTHSYSKLYILDCGDTPLVNPYHKTYHRIAIGGNLAIITPPKMK